MGHMYRRHGLKVDTVLVLVAASALTHHNLVLSRSGTRAYARVRSNDGGQVTGRIDDANESFSQWT